MSSNTLKSLFEYKKWANLELFDLLSNLPQEQYPEELTIAVRTLSHVYVVDKIFQGHLLELPHRYTTTNTTEVPSLCILREAVKEIAQWYCQFLGALSEENLKKPIKFLFTDGDKGTMTIEEILLHIITHGGYHRGNVGQILKNISIAPPRDTYTTFLHLTEPARREYLSP